MATLQGAMTIARYVTNDTDATSYARSDTELLQYANDALKAIAKKVPSLFHALADIACIANSTMQTFNVADSLGLVSVLNVKNGNAVTRVERSVLDRFTPGWRAQTAATAEHWVPVSNDDFRFEVYPPAPTGQVLVCLHVQKPLEYAATATHTLPDSYTPIIADYIISMLDSKEDEYSVNGRAAMYMTRFNEKLGKSV